MKILKRDDLAKIQLPSLAKFEEYRATIVSRYPVLDMVLGGTIDGLNC